MLKINYLTSFNFFGNIKLLLSTSSLKSKLSLLNLKLQNPHLSACCPRQELRHGVT